MIAADTVKNIMETAKIEEVVGDFVQLKKRGVNYVGLCPFHNEKTPSFSVSPVKNLCKCFGCGEGGDPVSFVMKHEQLSFPEALRYLAKKYNIHIEEEVPSEEYLQARQVSDSLYLVNQFALEYYQKLLLEDEYGRSVGLSYFKERGFHQKSIENFGLGFALGRSNDFKQAAVAKQYELEILQKAGLVSSKENDFFRQRVLFPFYNISGKIVGFGGRILSQDKKQPKYLNTPESEVYQKSKLLYGIYQAKKAISKEDLCYMVEGYTDVISLHQGGIENVVASSGTSLTAGQILLVKRYSSNITLLYDGDTAGIKAALRGVDLILEKDMNVRVVLFPESEDPDSYLRKIGPQAFREYIGEKSQDFILFKVELLLADAGQDPIARASVLRSLVESVSKIPDPLKRASYIRQCSKLMEIGEDVLIEEMNRQIGERRGKEQQQGHSRIDEFAPQQQSKPFAKYMPQAQASKAEEAEFQERDIARILLAFGHLPLSEEETVAEFIFLELVELQENPGKLFENILYRRIVDEYMQALEEARDIDSRHFMRPEEPELEKLATSFLMQPYTYSPGWERLNVYLSSQKMPDENFVPDARKALERFKLKKIERLRQQAHQEVKDAQNPEEIDLAIKVCIRLDILRSKYSQGVTPLGYI